MVACFGRGKDNGSIGNELQTLANDAAISFGAVNLVFGMNIFTMAFRAMLFLRQVPFVDDDNDPFGLLLDFAGNMCILCCQALASIDQQQRHITALDSAGRAQHAEFLNARPDLASSPDACRIDQYESFPLIWEFSVN